MLDESTITRGDEGGGGADDPGGGLHGGSGQAGAARGEGDPGQGTNKDAGDINAAEDPMEFQVTLAKARRELHRTGQESDDARERMGDEEMAIGNDLQTVGVVHRVIGDERTSDVMKTKERSDTKGNPENGFESGVTRTVGEKGRRRHHSPVRWIDEMRARRGPGVREISFGYGQCLMPTSIRHDGTACGSFCKLK